MSPKSLSRIRALAFDAYGTLFDVYSVTALCEKLFPERGAALAQLWRAKQLQYSLLRSLMGRYDNFWRLTIDGLVHAARSLDLHLTAAAREQLIASYLSLDPFPDVKPGLADLKKLGLTLAILSNGAPAMLEAVVDHAGIGGFLDATISADAVKVFKPSPRVYGLAAERLQLPVSEIGFVSANSWDINGAASAGLTTLWIRRSASEPPEELGFAAAHVVGTIGELAKYCRGSDA